MSETDTSAPACVQGARMPARNIGTIDFLKALFAHTTEPIYVCSFANERDDPKQASERHVISRKPVEITAFMKKWDKPERGMFFCVGTLQPGAHKRNKESIAQSICLHADLDFNKIDMLPADREAALMQVLKHLGRLRFLPSVTVASGGGVHAYWLFKEPIDTQAEREHIEAALRQLADIVAGDLPVCEVSRVLRLPGSHNTKYGAWNEVEITSFDPDRRYDLEELEEWFSEQSPVMLRKEREHSEPSGSDPDDFFAEYAKKFGIKPPIDVQQRLENMMFMGGGDSSVHQTQLQCTAALLNAGLPKEQVVSTVLAYTKRAAGDYGSRWNWHREERGLERMCDDWLRKHPQEERKKSQPTLRIVENEVKQGYTSRNEVGRIEASDAPTAPEAAGNVVKMPVITPNPKAPRQDHHVTVGQAVLAKIAADGEQIVVTKDGLWFYSAGIWELRVDPKWLNARIVKACENLGFKNAAKMRNETRGWIESRPEFYRESEIPWDQHGKIPTRSGLVDPRTGALEPAKPEHFATWRVEVDYDPEAECPWWRTMIADMFGDRAEDEQRALVGVVQELMGAALIDRKPRALSKACVFWGIENRAKSGVLDVVTGLFGSNPISAGIGTIETTHGLMPFQRRAPWVLHEAFGGQWHLSATVKSIVTAEPVMINIKNGPMITTVVRAPIFWATNFQPQFKEATKAIVSRMIVIEVTRAFIEGQPIGAAAEAIRRGFSKPGEFIVATELPGLLNWAIAGLRRALERGSIASTESIRETAHDIHKDSNLVAGFFSDCIDFDPMGRIKSVDLCLAFSSWWLEEKGEDRRLPTNEAIGKHLKAMGDPRIGIDRKEMRDGIRRYYCGIALNEAGLRYHKTAYESRLFESKVATATAPEEGVNSLIPMSWDDRSSIIKMRAGHELVRPVVRSLTNDSTSHPEASPVTSSVIDANA